MENKKGVPSPQKRDLDGNQGSRNNSAMVLFKENARLIGQSSAPQKLAQNTITAKVLSTTLKDTQDLKIANFYK